MKCINTSFFTTLGRGARSRQAARECISIFAHDDVGSFGRCQCTFLSYYCSRTAQHEASIVHLVGPPSDGDDDDAMDIDYMFSDQEPSSAEFEEDEPSSSSDEASSVASDEEDPNSTYYTRVKYTISSYGIVGDREFATIMDRKDRISKDYEFSKFFFNSRAAARLAVFEQLARGGWPAEERISTPAKRVSEFESDFATKYPLSPDAGQPVSRHLLAGRWIDPAAYDVWMATTPEDAWILLGPEDDTLLPKKRMWLHFLITPAGTKVPMKVDYTLTVKLPSHKFVDDVFDVKAGMSFACLTLREIADPDGSDDEDQESETDPKPNMPIVWMGGFKADASQTVIDVSRLY